MCGWGYYCKDVVGINVNCGLNNITELSSRDSPGLIAMVFIKGLLLLGDNTVSA